MSEDVCRNIRNVKLKSFFLSRNAFIFPYVHVITAVCFLFLLKIRWPKNKSSTMKPGLSLLCSANFEQLFAVPATSSNILHFWATFEQNIGLEKQCKCAMS